MSTGTEAYYQQRAPEYDAVYAKPERQADLAVLTDLIGTELAGRRVLDIAAGTGYWPERYADRAAAVLVTDANDAPLAEARQRRRWPDTVAFQQLDAYALDEAPGRFDAAFLGFFWSHISVDRLDALVAGVVDRLEPGSRVVTVDNRYVEGSSTPLARTDAAGNTYQRRPLADGSTWEIMKNFPSTAELRRRLAPFAHGAVVIEELQHFWLASFTTGRSA